MNGELGEKLEYIRFWFFAKLLCSTDNANLKIISVITRRKSSQSKALDADFRHKTRFLYSKEEKELIYLWITKFVLELYFKINFSYNERYDIKDVIWL